MAKERLVSFSASRPAGSALSEERLALSDGLSAAWWLRRVGSRCLHAKSRSTLNAGPVGPWAGPGGKLSLGGGGGVGGRVMEGRGSFQWGQCWYVWLAGLINYSKPDYKAQRLLC